MKVGILGSGVMARGIFRLLTSKKQSVYLIDPRNIASADALAGEDLDLIIECIVEDFDIKVKVLRDLRIQFPSAYIVSCTSSLSIESLQSEMGEDSSLLGMHFMNPPLQIRTVEVVVGPLTDKVVVQEVKKWLGDLGQIAVVVPDRPGFVVNALLFSMLNRAALLLESNDMSMAEIDELVTESLGHKIGPFKTMDLIGIDTCSVILENLFTQDPMNNLKPAAIFKIMIAEGKLGRKTKSGFYNY